MAQLNNNSSHSIRGQALVEFSVVLALFAPLIWGTLVVFYLGFARLVLIHSLQEGLGCLAELQPRLFCALKIRNQVSSSLPWGKLRRLDLYGKGPFRGSLLFQVSKDIRFELNDELRGFR